MPEPRKLRVFLCHSSNDKPAVRELYQRLKQEGWIDPWLDDEKLLPGQDWDLEIEKAVEAADAVIIFLSNNSVSKEGYIQRELRFVLRIADFKPEGTVFVIPVRLEDCPLPRRLSMWQYIDYFPANRKDWAYERLLGSLKVRARKLEIPTINPAEEQARREAEEKAKKEKEERERKEREEKARREKEAADRVAKEKMAREAADKAAKEKAERVSAEKAKKEEHERKEHREEIAEKARKEEEEREWKTVAKQIPIPKEILKRYGIISLILAGFIGLIFSGTYLFRNLPSLEGPIQTKQIVISTDTLTLKSSPSTPPEKPNLNRAGLIELNAEDQIVISAISEGAVEYQWQLQGEGSLSSERGNAIIYTAPDLDFIHFEWWY